MRVNMAIVKYQNFIMLKQINQINVLFLCVCGAFFSLPVAAEFALETQKIGKGVYVLVGELTQRSPENYANNSTHGVIVTDDGVILIDSGGSYQGAKQIHNAIKAFTDKSVKLVINTGGQDHRWLGNGYFKEHGARILSSTTTLEDQHDRAEYHMDRLHNLIGDSLEGTKAVFADEGFKTEKIIEMGGVRIELNHVGAAHTLGDSFVWLPSQKIMFAGDIVFVERALGIGPAKNAKSWMQVFQKMAAYKPEIVVPGHGHATDFATATRDTYDYLDFLVQSISKMLEEGKELEEAAKLDQSAFSYLKVFDVIASKNAHNLYTQLEFDSF